MTHASFDPALPHDRWEGPSDLPPRPDRPGRRSTVGLVIGILAIVGVMVAGGAWAYQKVAGGGPQPESVMPASVIAFAKVDLDPSGTQKLDAIRFMRKFPDARSQVSVGADLRKVLIKGIQDGGGLKGVDYTHDIEPWLGSRVGLGLLPGSPAKTGGPAQPIPVMALAVRDADAAGRTLPIVAASLHGHCRVLDAYALCAGQGADIDKIVASVSTASLESSSAFSKDMANLGENGIASAWFDLGALSRASAPSLSSLSSLSSFGVLGLPRTVAGMPGGRPTATPPAPSSGRMAMALRFSGANLELAGHVEGASTTFTPKTSTNTGLQALPQGTLAAVGIADAGDQLRAGWPPMATQLRATMGAQQYTAAMAQVTQLLGIRFPDDVARAMGSQLEVAFAGMGAKGDAPQVAIVSNGDPAVLTTLANHLRESFGAAPLTVQRAGQRTVVTPSKDYAASIASGSGLGDTATFRDALPDAPTARVAAYVDIAGILEAFKGQVPADDERNLAALAALGATVSGQGHSADFRVRLTTR